jgi:glycine/D-amino acid oxidase-like deaminating enzyme/nitrite reductase/ring-hydroxylating ferredoxin subunit
VYFPAGEYHYTHMENNNSLSHADDGKITSGANIPFWFSSETQPIAYKKLDHNIETDILVVGGGIAGLTSAYCLAKAGRKVVLVEDGFICSGETGRTTAHITCALDDRYFELEKTFDIQTTVLVAASHQAAIQWIVDTVALNNIDCHLRRVDGYLFLNASDMPSTLKKEFEATQRAGLRTELLNAIPFLDAEDGNRCIKFPNQAQFHILLYLKGLANAFVKMGGEIYTETKAEKINKEGAHANGFNIAAKHIVVATNSPINNWVETHTKQWPYRTYVIAAKIPKGTLPYALWWDTGDPDSRWLSHPYHYIRLEEFNEQYDILIAGGEDHRTGQADDEQIEEQDRYIRLEAWTRRRFPDMQNIKFKWSGQIMEPLDSLAYLGKNPGDDNIYIITGDSGNGMTHATLGGIIITDIITGEENPWIKIYDPSRISFKKKRDYLHEAGNMVAQYADWFTAEEMQDAERLKPGCGAVISSGLKKLAVYRDPDNILHTCTAVCPHLGAILQWNEDEKSFDCPMHGSRFTATGMVINGPATDDLEKLVVHEFLSEQ